MMEPSPSPDGCLPLRDERLEQERRNSGARARARDQLMDRATREYPKNLALFDQEYGDTVGNLILFIDDDLRETALAIARIEEYLVDTLRTLERPHVEHRDVTRLAASTDILEHVDMLGETVESLRRRLSKLANSLK